MPKIPMPSGPISHALPRGNLVTSGWVKTYDAPLLFGSGAWKKEWWLLYLTHIDAFNDKAHSEQFANYLVTKKKKRTTRSLICHSTTITTFAFFFNNHTTSCYSS